MEERWKPNVTVAAVIERDGRFLLVEEHTPDGLRLNNAAGHLDQGECPIDGCCREVQEETLRDFTPTALLGIYLARSIRQGNDITYLRMAFCGTVSEEVSGRVLDDGIVRTVWMTPDEVRASRERHRSPLVVQTMEDYLAGVRHPLSLIHTDPSVQQPMER